jgi:hypothetical protein
MIAINRSASSEEKDYYHLQPVVDYLLSKGNVSHNDFLWGNNRTGYFCHLEKDIDFDDLLSVFEFPDTIKINKNEQTIDCFTTYSVIKGGVGNKL